MMLTRRGFLRSLAAAAAIVVLPSITIPTFTKPVVYPPANLWAETMAANFKAIYADRIADLFPDGVKLLNRVT